MSAATSVLSLHDALPIYAPTVHVLDASRAVGVVSELLSERRVEFASGVSREYERLRERSEEHTSELQSQFQIVCRLLLEKKNQRESKRVAARVADEPGVQGMEIDDLRNQ